MSGIHVARQGFVNKSTLPNIARQRGPVAYACSLLITGNGVNGAASTLSPKELVANKYLQRALTPNLVNSTPYWPDGQWSNQFSGTGQSYAVNDSAAFTLGAGDWTIEAWVYTGYAAGDQCVIGQVSATSAASTSSFGLYATNSTGYPRIQVAIGGSFFSATSSTQLPLNQWVHLAGVRNSSTITLYMNGVSVGTYNASTNAVNDSAATVSIARPGDFASTYFNGYISNVRVVNGAAIYTANFTPPTAPLTAVSGTALLTCQSNRFKDNSSNNFAITITGAPAVQQFAPFTPPASPRSYGGSEYQTGAVRGAFYTDPVPITTGEFCIEFWCNPENFSALRDIINSRAWSTGNNKGWMVQVTTAGKIVLSASVGTFNTMPAVITTTTSLVAGAWSHVAIVRDASNVVKVFINGVQDATTATYSASLDQFYSSFGTHYFVLGNNYGDGQFQTSPFNGNISNIRIGTGTGSAIYTSAFTPPTSALTATTGTVFLARCDLPYVVESSDYNASLIPVGTPSQSTTSPFSSSYPGTLAFNGTSDYLKSDASTAGVFGTGDFTVEYFVNASSWSTAPALFDTRALNTSTTGYSDTVTSAGKFLLYLNNSIVYTSNTTLAVGTWYHIAVSRQGTSIRVFINGVRDGSTLTNSTNMTDGKLLIANGRGNSGVPGTAYFSGRLSNLRVVRGTALYTANFTPSTTPLATVTGTSLLLLGNNIGISDSSANGYAVNVFGNTQISTAQSKFGGSSLRFGGTGDYLTVASATPLLLSVPLFQVECWVYRATTGVAHTIASKGTSTTGWMLQINASDKLALTMTTSVLMTSTSSIPANTWTHIAITRDAANTNRMFVNGVLEASNANSSGFTQTNDLILGADRSFTNFFNGYIDDFRIFRDGVKNIATFTAPTAELPATDDCYRYFLNTAYGVYQLA